MSPFQNGSIKLSTMEMMIDDDGHAEQAEALMDVTLYCEAEDLVGVWIGMTFAMCFCFVRKKNVLLFRRV
jgi:hypothetical protein